MTENNLYNSKFNSQSRDSMTDVDYKRLYLGLWVAAEGQVFPFREKLHTHNLTEGDIPSDALKFCSIEFGSTHPFVCLWWWLDQKGIIRTFKEIYLTNQLVSDMGNMINTYNKEYNHDIVFYVSNSQIQERRIMSNLGIHCRLLDKDVIDGIKIMKRRFIEKTIQYRRIGNLLHEKDKFQYENELPFQTIDEFDGYSYKPLDKQHGNITDDYPIKGSDDGIDASISGIVGLKNHLHILFQRIYSRSPQSA